MARPLSPQKQAALLEAAVAIVAQSGLSATTASIAKRAEVAVGTLFTYFPTKEQLLNEVYLMLKQDMSDLLVSGYPKDADFRTQIMHIWRAYHGMVAEKSGWKAGAQAADGVRSAYAGDARQDAGGAESGG